MIIKSILLILLNLLNFDKGGTFTTEGYFPCKSNIKLIFKSSFGSLESTYTQKNDSVFTESKSDDFLYKQKLIKTDKGILVLETHKKIKAFLFISSEKVHTYNKPLIRLPNNIELNQEWNWKGIEYTDGDADSLFVSGKFCSLETIKTNAGSFNTLKIETSVINKSGAESYITEWYAEGLGPVKTRIKLKGGGFSGFITKFLGYSEINFELDKIISE